MNVRESDAEEMACRKKELRKAMSAQRNQVNSQQRERIEALLTDFARRALVNERYENYYLYVPFRSELPVWGMLEGLLGSGKKVFVPRVHQTKQEPWMEFYPIFSRDDLQPGAYGILEPKGKEAIIPNGDRKANCMLLPGLAFSREGGRLGYGGGYYDRYLGVYRDAFELIGAGYDFQCVRDIPLTGHDIRMDRLLLADENEVRLIPCSGKVCS